MLIESAREIGRAVFDEAYLARLRAGDDDTARHFDGHFRRLVRLQLWGRFSPDRVSELVDDVMAAVIEKVMSGEPREAACLPGYVRGICANLQKREIKSHAKYEVVDLDLNRLSGSAESPEESALNREKASAVWRVIEGLRVRHRNVLLDVHYYGLDRDEACQKYGVTREQLKLILFHARRKFQKEWDRKNEIDIER
jgi:RNA polymerase sigma factor (sigma-70 family)